MSTPPKARILEVTMGIAVLVILAAIIINMIRDYRRVSADRDWMEQKFDQLLDANDSLVKRVFNGQKAETSVSSYLEAKGYAVSQARSYLKKKGEDDACDMIVVPGPTGDLATYMGRANDAPVTFTVDMDALSDSESEAYLNMESGSLVNAIIAYKPTMEGEACGAAIDVLGVMPSSY